MRYCTVVKCLLYPSIILCCNAVTFLNKCCALTRNPSGTRKVFLYGTVLYRALQYSSRILQQTQVAGTTAHNTPGLYCTVLSRARHATYYIATTTLSHSATAVQVPVQYLYE